MASNTFVLNLLLVFEILFAVFILKVLKHERQ